MYFLLDLCCKLSRADALPQAPCTASVSPADAKVTPTAQQQHRATPSVLDPTPISVGGTSSGSNGHSSSQLSNAAASAGDPSPHQKHTGLHSKPAAAGSLHEGSENPSMTPEAAVLGAMAAAAAAGAAAAAAAAPSGEAAAAATGAAAETAAAAAAAASPLDKVQAAMSHKPCRACTTAQDMLAAFRTSQFSHSSSSSSSKGKSSHAPSQPPAGLAASSESSSNTTGSGSASTADSSSHTQQTSEQQQQPQHEQQQPQKLQPFWFYEDEMPCPPDILELGRATWTLLHSVAAYYPDQPTEQQQLKMRAFVDALGEFYPCEECRGHLVKELQVHPPDVGSAAQLSHWACRLHNLVNIRLGKPGFDCSRVMERWRDGPADDDDACAVGH